MTENEITQLGVDQSTISRDIKALKELSQQFVFNLTESDLAYYYKQCIDGIEEVRRKDWDIFKNKYNNFTKIQAFSLESNNKRMQSMKLNLHYSKKDYQL
jgi:hypothetical protein